MNVRTFLLGALCGAVLFSIIDRLMEERERRLAAREKDSPAADVRSEAPLPEGQSAVTPAPDPGPEEHAAAPAAALDQDIEAAEPASGEGDPTAAPPRGAASEDMPKANEPEDSQSDVDGSSEASATAAVPPDDESWGPFMEQALRQFLARHPSAPKFDVLSIVCGSGQCEIRAAGFDESTWPVWQQVLYDLSQQPWYEFGVVGSDIGRYPEFGERLVLRTKLKRRPRT